MLNTANMPQQFEDGQLDVATGMVTYKGQTMTYKDYKRLCRDEYREYQDSLEDLRDVTSDIQALWGTKADRFMDNWQYRKKPYTDQTGRYPVDTDGWTE